MGTLHGCLLLSTILVDQGEQRRNYSVLEADRFKHDNVHLPINSVERPENLLPCFDSKNAE